MYSDGNTKYKTGHSNTETNWMVIWYWDGGKMAAHFFVRQITWLFDELGFNKAYGILKLR